MEKIWHIIDLIEWGKNFFNEKGIDDARLNIELLLCNVLNCDRLKLYLDFDKPLNSDELTLLKEKIRRRAKHEPLQYIIGQTQFYKQTILLNNEVLIPRPETEELVELILKNHNLSDNLKILDIGCGSGCISLALASEFKNSQVVGIDLKESILDICRKNSKLNNINNVDFKKLDILHQIPEIKFDIIVSNPPYINENEIPNLQPEVTLFEPHVALNGGNDGLLFYRRFKKIISMILCEKSDYYFEFGYNQHENIQKIFSEISETVIHKDFNGLDRFISGKIN